MFCGIFSESLIRRRERGTNIPLYFVWKDIFPRLLQDVLHLFNKKLH